MRGQLLAALKSLHKQSEVCVLPPLLFIMYMDKIDKDNSSSSGVIFGKCNVRRLLFADDLVLLCSNKSDLNMHLIGFLMMLGCWNENQYG